MYTVWEFKSVDGKQIVRSLRRSEPGEARYEGVYQRIVYCGDNYQHAKTVAAAKKVTA